MWNRLRNWLRKPQDQAKLDRAFAFGKNAGNAMVEAVDTFLDRRMEEVCGKLLAVFADGLALAKKEASPAEAIKAEIDLFLEHTGDFKRNIRSDLSMFKGDWLELAAETGVQSTLNELIDRKLSAGETRLHAAAVAMAKTAIDQLGPR